MSCPFPVFDFRASLWVPTSVHERSFVLSQGSDRAGLDPSVPLDCSGSKADPADRPVPVPRVAGELSARPAESPHLGEFQPCGSRWRATIDHPETEPTEQEVVLRRVACVASSGRAPLPTVWRGRSDDRLSSRPSPDRGVPVRPLSQGLQCVHRDASPRDPAVSRRTGADDRRAREERPGVSNRLHGWCRIGKQRRVVRDRAVPGGSYRGRIALGRGTRFTRHGGRT